MPDTRTKTTDRLFIGVFPCGIAYADRWREKHGDYVKLALLPYHTLLLEEYAPVPPELLRRIRAHAATIIARRGEEFEISTCGQTVRLGGDANTSFVNQTPTQAA